MESSLPQLLVYNSDSWKLVCKEDEYKYPTA